VIVFSTLKSLKLPMPYAASHYFLTYDEGFVKRGLTGAFLDGLGVDPSYAMVTVLGAVFYGVLLIGVGCICAAFIRTGSLVLSAATIVYAASISVVYLAGSLGYFDHLLVVLVLGVIWAQTVRGRVWSSLVLGSSAVLIHEGSLLLVLPVCYFAIFVAARPRGEAVAVLVAGAVATVHLVLTYLVVVFGGLPDESVAKLRDSMQAVADFDLTYLLFEVISEKGASSLSVLRTDIGFIAHVDSIVIVALSLVALLLLFWTTTRQGRMGVLTLALGILAALAPMALRFVATDIHRWDAMSILMAFLVVFVAWRAAGKPLPEPAVERWMVPLFVVAIAVSSGTTTFMVSHQDVDLYPFFEARQSLLYYFGQR
jgi:hypothetical protein